jgi:hypothetical protein
MPRLRKSRGTGLMADNATLGVVRDNDDDSDGLLVGRRLMQPHQVRIVHFSGAETHVVDCSPKRAIRFAAAIMLAAMQARSKP